MNTARKINDFCLEIEKALSDKGFVDPSTTFYFNFCGHTLYFSATGYLDDKFSHQDASKGTFSSDCLGSDLTSDPFDAGLKDIVRRARAWISALDAPSTVRKNAYIAKVGRLIDEGREMHDVEIDAHFINPLVQAMEKLSSNIITHVEAAE